MQRPDDLPDFAKPPIIEAVMSVQFAAPADYREIYARDVWALFEREFGRVQEQPALEPFFEVFGASDSPRAQIKLQQVVGPLRNRYWFLGPDDHELLQFQHDRFIHNWRKIPNASNEYPRFEPISAKFERELAALDGYFRKMGWGPIVPNQCELIYVNRLPLHDPDGKRLSPSFFFRRIDASLIGDIEGFAFKVQQRLMGLDGTSPIGRLYVEANTQAGDSPHIGLNLTARGAPPAGTISGALAFLATQRDHIVRTFAEITSDAAHKLWERRK